LVDEYYIFVTGTFSSGKSEFIYKLRGDRKYVAYSSPDSDCGYAYRYCAIEVDDDTRLTFFTHGAGVSGPAAWADLNYPAVMLGYIILVDSANLITWREAANFISLFRQFSPYPYIVVFNKQDQPSAAPVGMARHGVRMHADEIAVPCIATDLESVKSVVIALLESLL